MAPIIKNYTFLFSFEIILYISVVVGLSEGGPQFFIFDLAFNPLIQDYDSAENGTISEIFK